MMQFYGLSDRQVLEMPVGRFWLLSKSIDRIAAEKSIKLAIVMAQVQSQEGFSSLMTDLKKQMGEIVQIDKAKQAASETLDRAGLESLKSLSKAFG